MNKPSKNHCGWDSFNNWIGFNPPYWKTINDSCMAHDYDYELELVRYRGIAQKFKNSKSILNRVTYSKMILEGERKRKKYDQKFLKMILDDAQYINGIHYYIALVVFYIYYAIIRCVAWMSFYNLR